jgi:hypothetical protein
MTFPVQMAKNPPKDFPAHFSIKSIFIGHFSYNTMFALSYVFQKTKALLKIKLNPQVLYLFAASSCDSPFNIYELCKNKLVESPFSRNKLAARAFLRLALKDWTNFF